MTRLKLVLNKVGMGNDVSCRLPTWTKTRPATVALTQAMPDLRMEGQKGLPTAGSGPFQIYPPITINITMI